ncbi:fused MFS/spermidine synthase [Pararhizobium sp. DWP3-4]|uniref:fused MFS/spermidine synthase n=1 Tax=Pararhizobium sp. DWP3-4 TaxID=2804565 RepID=UPI003CF33003
MAIADTPSPLPFPPDGFPGPVLVERPYPLPELPPNKFFVEGADTAAIARSGSVFVLEDADIFDEYHYRAKSVICSVRTAFQTVTIADTYSFGRALFLDGAIQSSEEDEALYHEMLVHPALLMHENPRHVLIIGGGEGATLREVLAYGGITRAVMVDIDRDVVDICREHLGTWSYGAFTDPRAELHYCDGRAFVETTDDLFDVVIIDVVDMLDNGPAQHLYTREFYQMVRERLRPGGIVVVQALEFSFCDYKGHTAVSRTLAAVFSQVHSYQVAVPCFLASWGFLIASDWLDPHEESAERMDRTIDARLGADWLDHLTGAFIKASFCFDKETSFYLGLSGPILEDGVAFVPPPDIHTVDDGVRQLPSLSVD